ncbi:histone deacetylase-like protein [Candidatus Kinetoplastibacterium oncopeltii TCC290E]|uniref:Histone deacetylase-like protein n=1 Tax=Candidatus Kinetoplastidibacterium stringomonadis TCC290E TaxID=1208920 RepID=M1L742_9PROT|nr:histone deacetylase family protein [Candidatus Kinetoplastibacterium oncopeltii]AGF48413.1 histone deacetylase-like protein [Candidatus Kinetoplastibacterium oncopeltii TCC290E]
MDTMYITHPASYLHEMGVLHPDSPKRIDAISDQLIMSGVMPYIINCHSSSSASDKDILRVHTIDYLNYLRSHSPKEGSYYYIDMDTIMNYYTLDAAFYSAGVGLFAIDSVFNKHVNNAFCATRPPGHHACSNRAMGSCFFNNIAIAARYAISKYNLKRLAIIDFDVHHGNGTEEIFANDPSVLMCSFFQHPFYPDTKLIYSANMCNIPVEAYADGAFIRDIVSSKWVPAIESYRPELILISAGFDAHREDDMGQLNLHESDYKWITDILVNMSEKYSSNRIVSFLEGGYDMSSLGRSAVLHIRSLAKI